MGGPRSRFGVYGHSRSTENGTNVVGLLNAILGVPRDIVLVGKDSSAEWSCRCLPYRSTLTCIKFNQGHV